MQSLIHFNNPYGELLTGTLHLPETPTDRGVVLGHCFTCSRHTGILRQLGHDLAGKGFMALRFDFSGNGQSEGEFARSTYTKQISEMKVACDVIASRGAARIGLAGHSLGAVIALITAGEMRTIRAVCAIAGRLSGMNAMRFLNGDQQDEIDRTGRVAFTSRGRQLVLTRDFFADADRFDLPAIISALKTPLLIVHGDRDEIIPVDEAYTAHKRNPSKTEVVIVSGADHMFSQEKLRQSVSRQIVKWFDHRIATDV